MKLKRAPWVASAATVGGAARAARDTSVLAGRIPAAAQAVSAGLAERLPEVADRLADADITSKLAHLDLHRFVEVAERLGDLEERLPELGGRLVELGGKLRDLDVGARLPEVSGRLASEVPERLREISHVGSGRLDRTRSRRSPARRGVISLAVAAGAAACAFIALRTIRSRRSEPAPEPGHAAQTLSKL